VRIFILYLVNISRMSKAASRSKRSGTSKKRNQVKRKSSKRNTKRHSRRSHKGCKKAPQKRRSRSSRKTRRKTRRYRHMKGGTGSCPTAGDSNSMGSPGGFTIIPQELTNLGRSVQFGLGGAYNAVNGYDAPVNPMPYKGQLNGGNLPDDVMLRV
jgi:hypothetical protein